MPTVGASREPEGFIAISRWLSEATPPGIRPRNDSTLKGCQKKGAAQVCVARLSAVVFRPGWADAIIASLAAAVLSAERTAA